MSSPSRTRRIENEDREPDTSLLEALEAYARVALAPPGALDAFAGDPPAATRGTKGSPTPPSATTSSSAAAGASVGVGALGLAAAVALAPLPNWGASLPAELVGNLGRYRRYDYTCVRDLLRVVRNKRNHFREMPPSLQVVGREGAVGGRAQGPGARGPGVEVWGLGGR